MKRVVIKIIVLSFTFLVATISIILIANDWTADYQTQESLEQNPAIICGNGINSTENYQLGEVVFKSNCVACHKKYKDSYGPALQRFIKVNDSNTVQELIAYFQSERQANTNKKSNFVHQNYPEDFEIEQLVEYIVE